MTENKFNPEIAKKLYDQAMEVGTSNISEDDFYSNLDDKEYAAKVYNRYKDKYGVNLLDAEDDNSFLDTLGYKKDDGPTTATETKPVAGNERKPVNVETPESINTDVPKVNYVAPKAPDMNIEKPQLMGNILGERKVNPHEKFNMAKNVFGVDDIYQYRNPQEKLQDAINQLGKDEVETVYDDNGDIVGQKVVKTAQQLDVERIDAIKKEIQRQYEADSKFVNEYESVLFKDNVTHMNTPKDTYSVTHPSANTKHTFSMTRPSAKSKTGEDEAYLKENADRYNKIKKAREALQLQMSFADTYAELAEYDRSVAVGEDMSSMVSSGEITEDAMSILRSSKSPQASKEYIERQVKNGTMTRSTANKLYDLGDLSEKNAFGYGFTHHGKAEDMLSFGITEINRNFDVKDIYERIKKGEDVSQEETNVIDMYNKMSEMLSEAKQDKRGWLFQAGQGLPKTLQFIAEIGITGGASAVGKGMTRKFILESIKKYGLKRAFTDLAKETGSRLTKNAFQQAVFAPFTPSAYVDYSNRVLNMTFEQDEVSWKDKLAALYKSYAQAWSGRFSETLDNVIFDMPLGTWLYSTKYLKPVLEPAAWIAKKLDNVPWSKQTSEFLERFGIDGMHKEILTEMSDPLLYSAATGFTDTEELKKMDLNFVKQVALHSAILGGFHGAMSYGVGAGTAALENKRVNKAYDDVMGKISRMKFVDKDMDSLREELITAISRNNFVPTENNTKGRTVGEILGDMNARMQSFSQDEQNKATYKEDKRIFETMDYAARVGSFKFGANQYIKDQVAHKMGVKVDDKGNKIPIEFEHSDGTVHELSLNGKEYFILDESNSAVVVVDRATGEKEIISKDSFGDYSVKQTDANDWAMNTYLVNFNNWKAEEAQSNQGARYKAATPPTHVMLDGIQLPVTNFDAQSGEVTITDNTGDELTLSIDDPGIELVYPTQQPQVQSEENLKPVTEEAPVEQPEEAPDGSMETETPEPAYVAPRGEDNEVVWNEVPADKFKEVIDQEVGEEYADGYIDMRIAKAQENLEKYNQEQPPVEPSKYKAFMEQAKALQNEVAYWTNAKQEYANAIAQEMEQPVVEDIASEQPVMTDEEISEVENTETPSEQVDTVEAEIPAQEEVATPLVSKEELDTKVADWNTNGVKVNVVNSIDEITNEQVLSDMKKGEKITGWYDTATGEVYVFAPYLSDTAELDSTIIHEVVAHKGLRGLVGETYYKQFCEKVFDSMPKEIQDKYLAYPGVNGDKAAAADEYIAYLAEKQDLTAEEQTAWDKIIQMFRDLFDRILVNTLKKDTFTDEDIARLIRMSYANIKNEAANPSVEATTGVVSENAKNGQAMYSIKTYREGGRDNLIKFTQNQVESNKLTEEQANEIVSEMDAIYDMVQKFKDVYQPFGAWSEAEVKIDDTGKAVFSVVKPNGEYGMNLDFSLVCKKRRTLDSVFDEMIRRGIISEFDLGQVDIAKVNQIIREFGFETACRLCFVDAKRFRVAKVADDFCAKYNELVVMNNKQLKDVIKTEEKNSVRKKIAKHLLDNPEDKVILSRDNFMSAKGFEDVKVNKAVIMSLYNQAKGTGGPKASFGDVQYLNEIADSSWTPEAAYSVGGVRLQSFSDYVPRMVFDYVQMVADLAAKKLPVHSYTKESTFAKQFGLTGIKINMSLVPRVDADGIAPGLDKDGNYAWQDGETFPFDEAVAIQNAEGYKENCGTIAVGISDEHILKMLDDESIRMIIPYHKSGLNKDVAKFNNIDQFVDYTNSQNTRYADGKKLNKADLKNHFNFNEDLHKNNDPRGAAQRYLEWCDKNRYIPKFDQFRNHPNYYKLLEDFTTVVTENGVDTIVPQKAVEMKFPKETDAFGSMETLIQQGLEEDAILEGRRTEKIGDIVDKIEEVLPKATPTTPDGGGPRYRTADKYEGFTDEEKAIAEKAEADGTYLKAPNGKDTNLTPKQWAQVRTKAFKEWFGDWENDPQNASKVVDENGEPMVVYHGSISETIDSFDKSKIRANETDAYYNGFWFSTDPDTSPAWRSANKVYPVFLNIRNLITREDAHKIARKYFNTDDFVESLGVNGIRSGADAVRAKLQANGYDGVADFIHPKINISEFEETGQTIFKTSGGTKYIIAQESDGINVYEYDYYSDDHKGEFNTAVDSIEEFFDDAYFFGDETFVAFEPNQIKSATDNVGTFSKENNDIRYRTSSEIDKEYPNWLEGTTNESGKHSTQVTKTVGTYNKVGEWIENNLGKDVEILDASSGMGLGTQSLREKGFNIEDVEPYQSEDRKQNNPATYSAYGDIDKQYDYIISNAVLNVIPDDWRADVLHNMAERMKDGGKMFINTRMAGQEKDIKDKIELDTPQEVLVKRNGKISSYQKFFTPQELKSWVENELGEGYTVEVANEKNSGTKGLAAVVVTKKENPQSDPQDLTTSPSPKVESNQMAGSTQIKDAAKIAKSVADLQELAKYSKNAKNIKAKDIVNYLADALNIEIKPDEKESKRNKYVLPNGETLSVRVSGHNASANTYIEFNFNQNYNLAITFKPKRSANTFVPNNDVRLDEYVYFENDVNQYNGSVLSDVASSLVDFLKTGVYTDRTGLAKVNVSPEGVEPRTNDNYNIRYRIPSTPVEARQRAENIMKSAIEPLAAELGIEVNYVTNESISDVEPGARKKRQSKGWYQDGKVYINLSTQETTDDARETYLHEVVGHYGLRGLLKDQFEPVMQKVFASLTPTQQQSLLEIFADEVEAAEEFLSSMAENNIDPTIVDKVLGFIREALRSIGINLDNYTDADLQYLLWRSKNNLKDNAGAVETAIWEAKDKDVRYRLGFGRTPLSKDSKYSGLDKLIEQYKDKVWPVKLVQDEIVARGGTIDDSSDAYGQATLMPGRSATAIKNFNNDFFDPMLEVFANAAKLYSKETGETRFDSNYIIEQYLYARHAIERNRKITLDKMFANVSETFAVLSADQKQQLNDIIAAMYDDNYTGNPKLIEVVPDPNSTGMSTDLYLNINGAYQKLVFTEDEFDSITDTINQFVADNPVINESGMTDNEANYIIENVYFSKSAEMQDALDALSQEVRRCTDFILDTWMDFGIISAADNIKYKNQYQYYIPLRGWDETADVDYEDVAGNAYNRAEKITSLNKQARGRKSKADSPLNYISQMATSAIISGNKNFMKMKAYNMIRNNKNLISDLAFIDDKGQLTHKTKSEIKAHEVQLKVDGRTVRFTFNDEFEVGVAAATAIKGQNVQNVDNGLMKLVGAATRLQSQLRTSLNPVFMFTNGIRDYFFGNLKFFIQYGIKDMAALNANYTKGFACAFLDAAGVPVGDGELRKMYEEYKREGGQTGFVHQDDIKRLKRETGKILKKYQNGFTRVSSSVFKLPSYVLRVMGEPAENAMRFATYKTLRDNGVSARQAAKAAKEVTVNFNRSGSQRWPGMIYGFFNATLEGTANYLRMGFNKETATRFYIANAAMMALSYVMAGWAKGFDDDDDDIIEGMSEEELAEYKQQKEFANEYNRISDYVKHTNILIPVTGDETGEKKFIAIPLPQSFRIASTLGVTLRDIISNDKDVADELREFGWFTIGELQPFDIENVSIEGGGFLKTFGKIAAPTLIQPEIEVAQNRNFMGNPIRKESFINENYQEPLEPSYTKAGSKTPEIFISTAKGLNEWLGGDENIAAKHRLRLSENRHDAHSLKYILALTLDAADPSSVDHILKGMFGGFYEIGLNAIDRSMSDDDKSLEDLVVTQRFLKSATQAPGVSRYYEFKEWADYVERVLKNEEKHAEDGEENQYLNSDGYDELVKANKYWKKQIKKVTDDIAKLKKGGDVDKAELEALEAERNETILEAALEFESLNREYKIFK